MDRALFNLTFGVELEFVASYNPEDYEDRLLKLKAEGNIWTDTPDLSLDQKYGILVRMYMIEILNENGFPTNSYNDTDFSKWTVDTDGSVTAFEYTGSWLAIELKTPALSCCRASLDLIDRVVTLLVSKFKLFTNEKCGLHVHVGNEGRGFDLRTLKNFCSLITAFEGQLESLHPPGRVQNPFAKNTKTLLHHEATLTEKLSIIERLETVENLVTQFHLTEDGVNKYMAYNFLNLQSSLDSAAEPLRTIEFRQHRGTLDPNLITNWVTVVCGLIKESYTDKGNIREIIESSRLQNSKYPVCSLLEDLQLGKQAKFYAPLVFHHYGMEQNQNPATVVDSKVEKESVLVDILFPDQFQGQTAVTYPTITSYSSGWDDTPWEKEFTPRPSYDLTASWDNSNWDGQSSVKPVDEMEAWSLVSAEASESDKDAVDW